MRPGPSGSLPASTTGCWPKASPTTKGSFDLVVFSLTVYTIFGADPRQYAAVLARLNAQDISVRNLG
ncbi:hypothetical protein Acsp03_47570 [Actinomadura sp. NBRC 104412]|nr:hypothetical protein Acsp03_47570 [Actinomadura sp. NBRC 104412]